MSAGSVRLAAFRKVGGDRDLRRALGAFMAFAITEFGTWVVVLVYAYSVGDATTVGLVAVAQLIPAALLAPLLAVRLDRLARATATVVAYASQSLALAATAIAMAAAAPPLVTFSFAILANITVAMGRPAHNSLVPELVSDPAHLTAANVVTTSAENLGVFVGPAIAGFAMGISGPPAALGVLVIFMIGGSLAVATVPRIRRPVMDATPVRTGVRTTIHENRAVLPFLIVGGAQQIAIGALDVLIVLLAIDELGLGDAGAGYLNAALGLGGVIGGLVAVSMVGRTRLTPTLVIGVGMRSISLILIGVFPAAALFLAGTGIGYSVVDVANRTLLQRTIPVDSMATVFGVLEGATMASLALGSLIAPFLAEAVGTTGAFAVMGAIMPVILVLVWRPLRRAEAHSTVALDALALLARVEMFGGLEPPIQEALARQGGFMDIDAGVPIVKEGEQGDRMWVIESGSVSVTRDGRQVAVLTSGDLFGEIALLSDVPRIATVTALEPCRLFVIDRAGFLDALATDAPMRAGFEEMARRRTRETMGE